MYVRRRPTPRACLIKLCSPVKKEINNNASYTVNNGDGNLKYRMILDEDYNMYTRRYYSYIST